MATYVWLQDNSNGKEAREYVEVKEEDTLYFFHIKLFKANQSL